MAGLWYRGRIDTRYAEPALCWEYWHSDRVAPIQGTLIFRSLFLSSYCSWNYRRWFWMCFNVQDKIKFPVVVQNTRKCIGLSGSINTILSKTTFCSWYWTTDQYQFWEAWCAKSKVVGVWFGAKCTTIEVVITRNTIVLTTGSHWFMP